MAAFAQGSESVRSLIRFLTPTQRQQLRNLKPHPTCPSLVYWSSRGDIHRKLRAAGLVQRLLLGDPTGGGFARLTPLGEDVVRELERTGT